MNQNLTSFANETSVVVKGTDVKVHYDTIDEYGWTRGCVEVPSSENQDCPLVYEFEAKVYNVGSKNGINDGRISKLYVNDARSDDEAIWFDRGWSVRPHCEQERTVLNALLKTFDTPKNV